MLLSAVKTLPITDRCDIMSLLTKFGLINTTELT